MVFFFQLLLNMRLIFLLSCLMIFVGVQAQSFSGTVLSADGKQPVAFASVYLSNTSIGTTTNSSGVFTFQNFPKGRFDLIVSCIGFEPYQTNVESSNLQAITIYLKPRNNDLNEVVVQSYEKDGWSKWGKLFIETFVGTSIYAQSCTIKNTNAIRFRFNKKENILTAFAYEPLIIENDALGYEIKYDLISYEYYIGKSLLYYSGYPFYTEMETSRKGKIKRWNNNRNEVYIGSVMHFMRALYRNTFEQENFELRRLYKIPNDEKIRIKYVLKNKFKTRVINKDKVAISGSSGAPLFENGDSSTYYNRILEEPDEKSILINQLLTGDSIAFAHDSTIAGLYFDNYIQVVYKGKSEPFEFAQQKMQRSVNNSITSTIYLINHKPVLITANGMYFEGTDLLFSGFWAWSEKMATMLPFDFKPIKK